MFTSIRLFWYWLVINAVYYRHQLALIGAAILLGVVLSLTGCASLYTAKTKASWCIPDGKCITYESDKDQQDFEAEFDPKTGKFHVKVMKSSTPEGVAALTAQLQLKMLEVFGPLIQQAGKTGGS